MPQEIQLFAGQQIRTFWDDDEEKYYFCIIDVVEALTESNDPKQYIKRMRQRDLELNAVWGTICTPHQFICSDGKRHQANCAPISGIRQSQIRAAVRVNSEMLSYYWQVGCDIRNRQFENRYGSRFYANASRDLRANLESMRDSPNPHCAMQHDSTSYMHPSSQIVSRLLTD